MRPSKEEVLHELACFMEEFSRSITRMYGEAVHFAPAEINKGSPLWRAIDAACDFGLYGIESQLINVGHGVYDELADSELFVTAVSTPQMELYLMEDEGECPLKVLYALQLAVARIVLEGGPRYTDLHALDGNPPGLDCLTIPEIAMLADMDERSVRNAANPSLPDPLKTVSIGKRTMVEIEEARRWLVGRKGYVPLQPKGADSLRGRPAGTTVIKLSTDLALQISKRADAVNQTPADFIASLLAENEARQTPSASKQLSKTKQTTKKGAKQ